ncbi:hypothetical protein KSP39_PZI009460 [Platanthera zijinensis]|uniref:Uncharacterized protein n=1 Tax=Platanthera zijinensis TaxID=2320716 RepID=A0AAP0BKF6_9ASPA
MTGAKLHGRPVNSPPRGGLPTAADAAASFGLALAAEGGSGPGGRSLGREVAAGGLESAREGVAAGGLGGGRPPAAGEAALATVHQLRMMGSACGGIGQPMIPLLLRWRSWVLRLS